jgi:molybdopterin-guanine dinucleotide biosynthesis protein A
MRVFEVSETYGGCVNGYRVVILAGGAGRRLGGAAKPTLAVAGQPMLVRVLAAVGDAAERVVVGPASLGGLVPPGVRVVREEPPGGGPVAALAAGLAEMAGLAEEAAVGTPEPVLVLAADLPLLTRSAVGVLLGALGEHDGAVFVDDHGRLQWLCGAWSGVALRGRLNEIAAAGGLVGRAMRELVTPLRVVGVPVGGGGLPPWYDCDTPAGLAAAERRLAT